MNLTIQSVLLNVTDLDRSIGFYVDVLDLRLVSRSDQVAALMINEVNRRQVLILREAGRNPPRGGRGEVGPRAVAFEAGSPDELDVIEQRLVDRQALVGRRLTETWRAIVGIDPDRIEITVASGLTGGAIRSDDWANLDEMVYEIG
jgi:catechol 2,3-dioxygenase-like lactoylglutathione lyase family enzyme